MADWSFLDREYDRLYEPYTYCQEKCPQKEAPPVPAQCVKPQAQSYPPPSPTLTFLLSPMQPPQPCVYNPSVTKVDNPREIRNKAEKQRRDKMNQSIARLADIVPPVARTNRKLDKTSILRLTAHYLRSHQHVFGNSIDRGPEFSMQFTQSLLNSLKGFLITTTYKGIVVVVSPNVQEFLGYAELELLGHNVCNIIHPDDHKLLKEQLFPRTCTLGSNGKLLIPKDVDAEKVMESLMKEKRSFIIRFKKHSHQRSDPPQYVTCHVEGSLRKSDRAGSRFEHVHIGRRMRSRGENPFSSGNDVVFVGMVRPATETFITESGLESFRMEYRTRHSIDGEIIQCEQRIALVTGYMTHEVSGVNAMNFMHRDDVRWVIIALREMYDENRLVGESCYRLMTKNGQFIYMRTLGWLDVDERSKAVTSFVCTNTVVEENEGKQLIRLMKKKFTLMVNNSDSDDMFNDDFDSPEATDDHKPPVEDPRQLEKVILHLVTNLPSPPPEDNNSWPENKKGDQNCSRLAIIPPRRERIQRAIEKSYSVIKTLRELNRMQENNNYESMEPPKTENASATRPTFATTTAPATVTTAPSRRTNKKRGRSPSVSNRMTNTAYYFRDIGRHQPYFTPNYSWSGFGPTSTVTSASQSEASDTQYPTYIENRPKIRRRNIKKPIPIFPSVNTYNSNQQSANIQKTSTSTKSLEAMVSYSSSSQAPPMIYKELLYPEASVTLPTPSFDKDLIEKKMSTVLIQFQVQKEETKDDLVAEGTNISPSYCVNTFNPIPFSNIQKQWGSSYPQPGINDPARPGPSGVKRQRSIDNSDDGDPQVKMRKSNVNEPEVSTVTGIKKQESGSETKMEAEAYEGLENVINDALLENITLESSTDAFSTLLMDGEVEAILGELEKADATETSKQDDNKTDNVDANVTPDEGYAGGESSAVAVNTTSAVNTAYAAARNNQEAYCEIDPYSSYTPSYSNYRYTYDTLNGFNLNPRTRNGINNRNSTITSFQGAQGMTAFNDYYTAMNANSSRPPTTTNSRRTANNEDKYKGRGKEAIYDFDSDVD